MNLNRTIAATSVMNTIAEEKNDVPYHSFHQVQQRNKLS